MSERKRVKLTVPRRVLSVLLVAGMACPGAPVSAWPEQVAASRLRVAAVQLQVSAADACSLRAFREHMHRLAREAVAAGANLLVYPEYTGVLAALSRYPGAVAASSTASQALALLRLGEPAILSVRDAFLGAAEYAFQAMCDVFGEIAARYRVHVVAGTYFARVASGGGPPELRNRALVFSPDGKLAYSQDKVYMTEFEDAVGIQPGSAEAAHPFLVEGHLVALTICRDTFYDTWDQRFAGAELWIDIKGNGEPYTPEVRERFSRAVPVRLRSSGVPQGVTVCLTGELLDFVWEGSSCAVRLAAGGEIETEAAARSFREEEIVVADVGEP